MAAYLEAVKRGNDGVIPAFLKFFAPVHFEFEFLSAFRANSGITNYYSHQVQSSYFQTPLRNADTKPCRLTDSRPDGSNALMPIAFALV